MKSQRSFFAVLFATFLIAFLSLNTSASAQTSINDLLKSKSSSANGSLVSTEQVRAELLAWAPEGVQAGKPVWLGLQLAHQPDWHTYYQRVVCAGEQKSLPA